MKLYSFMSLLGTFVQGEVCTPFLLACNTFSYEITLNMDCFTTLTQFADYSGFYLNSDIYKDDSNCMFQGDGADTKMVFDFDECGSADPVTTDSKIIYSTTLLFHGDSTILKTGSSTPKKFSCNIPTRVAASNGGLSTSVEVSVPDEGTFEFKPNDQTTILLHQSVSSNDPDTIPTIDSADPTAPVDVNVEFKSSFEVPLSAEWYLQTDETNEAIETTICDNVKETWEDPTTTISDCKVDFPEITVDDTVDLKEQFPELDQDKLDEHSVNKRSAQRVSREADLSDGVMARVLLKFKTSVKSNNDEEEIKTSILESQPELLEKVKKLAEDVTFSDSEDSGYIVAPITKEEYREQYAEKVELEQGAVVVKAVVQDSTPAPTPETGVWKYWYIPFAVLVGLALFALLFYLVHRFW